MKAKHFGEAGKSQPRLTLITCLPFLCPKGVIERLTLSVIGVPVLTDFPSPCSWWFPYHQDALVGWLPIEVLVLTGCTSTCLMVWKGCDKPPPNNADDRRSYPHSQFFMRIFKRLTLLLQVMLTVLAVCSETYSLVWGGWDKPTSTDTDDQPSFPLPWRGYWKTDFLQWGCCSSWLASHLVPLSVSHTIETLLLGDCRLSRCSCWVASHRRARLGWLHIYVLAGLGKLGQACLSIRQFRVRPCPLQWLPGFQTWPPTCGSSQSSLQITDDWGVYHLFHTHSYTYCGHCHTKHNKRSPPQLLYEITPYIILFLR
jgi:hypothetical protein